MSAEAVRPTPAAARQIYLVAPSAAVSEMYDQIAEQNGAIVHRYASFVKLAERVNLAADDLLIVDEAAFPKASLEGSPAPWLNRSRTILVTKRDAERCVRLLSLQPGLCHLLSRGAASLPPLLGATTQALLDDSGLTSRALLAPTAVHKEAELTSTDDMHAWLAAVDQQAQAAVSHRTIPGVIGMIASELAMNAVFHAPYDAEKRAAKYRERPRDQRFQLAAGEHVQVASGFDEHTFVLSVRDRFGTLSRRTILGSFSRAASAGVTEIDVNTPGAGVGLYMVFYSAVHLAVRLLPGRATEIVAVVGLSKRFRDFAQSGHSFSMFHQPPGVSP